MVREQNGRKLFFVSLLLHVVILAILIVNLEFSSQHFVLENAKDQHVVNAMILDESKIQKASPTPMTAKAKQVTKRIEVPHPVAAPKKQVTPPPKQEVKKPLPKPVQKNTIAIPDKRKKLQKELMEKELLAELKQAQKNKRQKEIEKEFQKELKAAKAAQAAKKAQAAKALEREMEAEQNSLASANAQKMRGIVDKYKPLIIQAIAQHWLVPNGVDRSLSAQLLIRVSPGGTVLDVHLVKSSGDEALDRSARTAVFKASPLPVPTDPSEFEPFKEFVLKVKPENVLARDNGLG